jgi:hypothetical protein
MIIKLPPPVTIKLPEGNSVEYSLPEMARFLARNARSFGGGKDADSARRGLRIESAFAAAKAGVVELTKEDGEYFKKEVESPSCGWANLTLTVPVQTGVDDKGAPVFRNVTRRIAVSGIDVLPLIDAVPSV